MGIKKTFEDALGQDPKTLQKEITSTQTYEIAQELELSSKETTVVTALCLCFTKMAFSDRDLDDREREEIRKRLNKFLKIPSELHFRLLNSCKSDHRRSGSLLFAASITFLSQVSNDKTRERIYRYLTHISAADKVLENEEEYLLRLIGKQFGLSEKQVGEYLLATELQLSLEEIEKKDPWKDQFSTGEELAPVIKFDLDS